jgi:hypothetical protein
MQIFGANFGLNTTIPVTVDVLSSATTAQLSLTADYTGTANDGTMLSTITLEISGEEGVQVIEFVSGTQMSAVVNAINTIKDSTGVSATLVDPADFSSGIVFTSTEFGSDAFVGIRRLGDSGDFFDSRVSGQRATGNDVTAIVNGQLAIGEGLALKIRNPTLKLEMLLDPTFAQQTTNNSTFQITGGGAL